MGPGYGLQRVKSTRAATLVGTAEVPRIVVLLLRAANMKTQLWEL